MRRLLIALLGLAVIFAWPAVASADGNDDRVRARVTADGSQEVGPVETDMTGRFRVEIEDGELEFRLKVRDNTGTIVAAHIHCAAPGMNGSVGVNLGVEPFTRRSGTVVRGEIEELGTNGCGWTSVEDVAAAIEANAAYVNVHTIANPGGEIRGDLSPR